MAPDNADALATAAWAAAERASLGAEAVAWAERAKTLNPGHPRWYDAALGTALFYAGDYARAAEALARGVANSQTLLLQAAAEGYLGREEAARALAARLRAVAGPGLTVQDFIDGSGGYAPEAAARLIGGARRAGLPITAEDLRGVALPAALPLGPAADAGDC